MPRARRCPVESLDAKRIKNGGTLPPHDEAALPGTTAEPLQSRLDKLIDELKAADGAKPLPEPIHARLGDISDGFRNRSSGEYMAKVHRAANHKRPTLQLLLVKPKGVEGGDDPYVCLSFGWAADEEQRLGQEFAAAAIGVLQRENRAMRSQELLDQVVAERPQFRDFYVQHADLDKLLTDEILNANDITVVCHKPITYQYHT